MKNFIAIFLIIIIMVALTFAILHVTGVFRINDYLISKAKENPKWAEWFQTHDEVVALNTQISDLSVTITDKDKDIETLNSTIKKLEKDLVTANQKITNLTDQIAMLERQAREHSLNIKEMADIYSQMEPQRAAEILQGLENDLVIQIFKVLKKDITAEILSFFSTERASQLSNDYTQWVNQ